MDEGEEKGLRAQLAALTAAVQALTAVQVPRGTFDGTLMDLLEIHASTWPRDATWAVSRRSTLLPAARHFAERPARSLAKHDWVYHRDKVRAHEITKRKAKPENTTLNYEMACWRAVYRVAVEEKMLAVNPLVGIKPLKAKKNRQTEITLDDVCRMRPHLDNEGWAYALLYQRRGLRAVESRRLEWANVDLEEGRIRFMAAKTRLWTTVRITSDVIEALAAIKPELPGRWVFTSPKLKRQPVNATTLWRKWREAADAIGLTAAPGDRRPVPHDQRHGFTSDQARKNPIAVAMRMSRHAGYRSAQRYIHCNEDDMESAYEKLEAGTRKPPARVNTAPVSRSPKSNTLR